MKNLLVGFIAGRRKSESGLDWSAGEDARSASAGGRGLVGGGGEIWIMREGRARGGGGGGGAR